MSNHQGTSSTRTYELRSREQKVGIPLDTYDNITSSYRLFTGIKESSSSPKVNRDTGLAIRALHTVGLSKGYLRKLLDATELYPEHSGVQDLIFLIIARAFCKEHPGKVRELDEILKTLSLPVDITSRLR